MCAFERRLQAWALPYVEVSEQRACHGGSNAAMAPHRWCGRGACRDTPLPHHSCGVRFSDARPVSGRNPDAAPYSGGDGGYGTSERMSLPPASRKRWAPARRHAVCVAAVVASAAGGRAVVLAAEWHTVDAVLHQDWLLRLAGMREQVALFWNANNTSLNLSQFVAAQKRAK